MTKISNGILDNKIIYTLCNDTQVVKRIIKKIHLNHRKVLFFLRNER